MKGYVVSRGNGRYMVSDKSVTTFHLKLMAMATMLIDHVGFLFFDDMFLMRLIGRCAFLFYAFMMAETYRHVRRESVRLQRHVVKLFLLTVVSEPLYDRALRGSWVYTDAQSVMLTFLIAFCCLFVMDSVGNVFGKGIVLVFAMGIAYVLKCDYDMAGVFLVVMFFLYREKYGEARASQRVYSLFGILWLYWFVCAVSFAEFDMSRLNYEYASFAVWIPMESICMGVLSIYGGAEGYRGRAFDTFYSLFYPLHLGVLALVSCVL